jgi:hypothetical protein
MPYTFLPVAMWANRPASRYRFLLIHTCSQTSSRPSVYVAKTLTFLNRVLDWNPL